jgi:hypothetical protein
MTNTNRELIYAYDDKTRDFRIFEQEEWKKQLTSRWAKNYLLYHLKQAVINDFSTAMNAYLKDLQMTKVGKGFFGSLRIIFPTITFLGALYKGKDESDNAVAFMEDYLGAINPLYEELSDLIYKIYRHGLMHTQMPKVITINNWIVGWKIIYDDSKQLQIECVGQSVLIPISPNSLFHDLINAIDSYINDFDSKEGNELLESFKKGFIEMAKVFPEKKLEMCPKGVGYIKNLIAI